MDTVIILAIIAVLGTLAGAIVSAIGTHIVQSKAYERENKREIINIKRDLLSRRLDIIEEAVTNMMFFTSRTIKEEVGIPVYRDKNMIAEKMKRLEEIRGQAWTAVLSTDSDDLKECYQAIASANSDSEKYGTVDKKTWDKAYESFPKIVKLIDNMKAEV